jgi:hypothetical protein
MKLIHSRSSSSRSRFAHIFVSRAAGTHGGPSDMTSVNRLGLGTDMWRVPFDNITSILKVRCRKARSTSGVLLLTCMIQGFLHHRASLPDIVRPDKDISFAVLPPHFPSPNPPTRHLVYNRTLCLVHLCIRYRDRVAVHSHTYCLGKMGWGAHRKMPQFECSRVGICQREHSSRFNCDHPADSGAQEPRHKSSTKGWCHVDVPRWILVSSPSSGQAHANTHTVLPSSACCAWNTSSNSPTRTT